jgi:beta-N-acetylhexosaminidase
MYYKQSYSCAPTSDFARRLISPFPVELAAAARAAARSPTSRSNGPEIRSRRGPPVPLVASSVAMTSVLGGPAAAGSSDRIDQMIERMTLEEKVGQLFVTYAYGQTADTTDPVDVAHNEQELGVANGKELIEKYHVGGVIYFVWSNNVANPEQIAGLSNGLQRVATAQRSGIPLLISTDQEHGAVNRVGPPATQLPGYMALGAGRSVSNVYDADRISGSELRAIGVNQDFAPVCDVNVNAQNPVIGVRSFGSDPSLVSDLVSASVDGYRSADVVATAKHFPGHGDTTIDSHYGVPIINHTRAEWERIDAPPFRAAISRGVDSIMTAHIVVPALDPSGVPATLSESIITGILRDELGYDGVVITDSLAMQGVRDGFGDDRIPVLALRAGVDQLLMPAPGMLDLEYNAVLDAVRSGELTEDRIDRSVHRVLQLKMSRGLFTSKNVFVDESQVSSLVGTDAHQQRAQEITDTTVTVVKDDANTLPLAKDAQKILVTGASVTPDLAERISARGPAATAYDTGTAPDGSAIAAAVAQAQASDEVVVATDKAWADAGQQTLVKQLLATGKPVVVVAVRDPYDIAHFTDAPTYLATFSTTAISVESLTRVLFGEVQPAGLLPVSIPTASDPGATLYPFGHGLTSTS